MRYPPVFQYSQSNLQDYLDCARRFQLRHLDGQPWPAPLVEPLSDAEAERRLGEHFHRLIERYYLGIPVEPPVGIVGVWWEAFLDHLPANLPRAIRRPEALYSVPLADRRLVAKFDLLAIDPRRQIVIVDWKTGRLRPSRESLASRMQTRVYLFTAVEALAAAFGETVRPAAVKLIYWFAAAPEQPEVFTYSEAEHEAARRDLTELIESIERHAESIWPLTAHLERCRACNYRSLCERGVEAASVSETVIEDDDESEVPDEIAL